MPATQHHGQGPSSWQQAQGWGPWGQEAGRRRAQPGPRLPCPTCKDPGKERKPSAQLRFCSHPSPPS